MILKPWFAAVLAAVALAGCAQFRAAPTSYQLCNGGRCKVEVGPAAPGVNHDAAADPEVLEIARGAKKVHIFFRLKDGYEFDPGQGDGVHLKAANDGQFSEMFETDGDASDNTDPVAAHRPAPRFHWRDANTNVEQRRYKYKIQFRRKGSATDVYFLDPIIINSGSPDGG